MSEVDAHRTLAELLEIRPTNGQASPAPARRDATFVQTGSKYEMIIRQLFFAHWQPGVTEFEFDRDEIDGSALGLNPKNVGDIIYSYRYRKPLPPDVAACAPPGTSWLIVGRGVSRYAFITVSDAWFEPSPTAKLVRLTDHTAPEVFEQGTRDEQVVLTMIAKNRLLDLFLWCRLERKQAHWRTTAAAHGQSEVDDVYVGFDHTGGQVVVTVQAKRDRDKISAVQIMQDIAVCNERADDKRCRPVAVHYDSTTERLALMEFAQKDNSVEIVREVHYVLTKTIFLG